MPPVTNGLICRKCGNEFSLITSAVRQGRGRYCSRRCALDVGRATLMAKAASGRTATCRGCGREYTWGPNDYRVTCSSECVIRARKQAAERARLKRAAAAISDPYTASDGSSFCLIALGRSGAEAIIDAGDADLAKRFSWTLATQGYAASGIRPVVYLHRLIMAPPAEYEVDHINRNKLDNRRRNLRVVTRGQNQQNIAATSASRTGVRGVWVHRGRYSAAVKVSGKRHWVGAFSTLGEAKIAVEAARARLMTHAEECGGLTETGCSVCRMAPARPEGGERDDK